MIIIGMPRILDDKEICESIFNGYIVGVREANKNIASLGYNMLYNNLLMLTLDDDTVNNDDCVAGRFSLGSWMRNENNVDSYMNEKTGTLEAGMKETRNILNAHLHISGPYMTNHFLLHHIIIICCIHKDFSKLL